MYLNKSNDDIYIYNIETQQYLYHFCNIKHLVEYFAKYKAGELRWWDNFLVKIPYFEKMNLTLKDTVWVYDCKVQDSIRKTRPYVFLDANMRILNLKNIEKDIDLLAEKIISEEKKKEDYTLKRGEVLESRTGIEFRYRMDPVPDVGKASKYSALLRHPKTKQEFRLNCKYKKYVRKKRTYIPTSYDDIVRSDFNHKSWKKQTKCKHQWEKNLR